MQDKIDYAKHVISEIARTYKNPIIYCSFGKDSICVLHLCRAMGLNWPVMFHREPEFPDKFRYQNQIIADWGVVCRDYPPELASAYYNEKEFYEVATHFSIGGGEHFILCGVLYKPDEFVEGKYLCALNDLYYQPKCSGYDYLWDIGLRGCKDVDKHPHTNAPFKLRNDIQHNIGCVDFSYPIRTWTDEDIYTYFVLNNIPINTDIYDIVNGRLENKKDKTFNADYRPACFECMKSDSPETVYCPRKGMSVNNVWERLVKILDPADLENINV